MDVKVYRKEEVLQPSGTEYVYVPNVIDFIPEITTVDGVEYLSNATILEEDRDITEQECALVTIWQRGLDPLNLEDGIQWSEVILNEINVIQLMQEISEAVASVTATVRVTFSTVKDSDGNEFLTYKIEEVA